MDSGGCTRVAFDGNEARGGLDEVECELAGDIRQRCGEPLDVRPDRSMWYRREEDSRGAVDGVLHGVDSEGADGAVAQD